MSEIFLTVFNMSISAGWIVLAVLLLRLLLRRAPKWIAVLLWGVVAIRLVCPIAIESVVSLIPSAETISPQVLIENPQIHTGFPALNYAINPIIQESTVTVAPEKSINVLQLLVQVFSKVWAVGMVAMLLYAIISYILVKRKIGTAVILRENIYQCEGIGTPFVLGIVKPKIYLPFPVSEQDAFHVIAHERAHICRKDHWWKPLGFLVLALHWFNPLMWLAYILLCRDIELACDEKVVKEWDVERKADYSQALLACSVGRRRIAACPLAFGESGVKGRIRSVLQYKKPTVWVIAAALLVSAVVAVCFLTNPTSHTIQKLALGSEITEDLRVYISDGEGHVWIHNIESDNALKFLQVRISQKEISLDRSEDRDKSHTVTLQKYDGSVGKTSIYLNENFTQVWVDDGVKPTLSYRIISPNLAREAYRQMTVVNSEPTVVQAEELDATVSYAGWSEMVNMYDGALGDFRMALSCIQTFPMRKFDTLKEFEAFKDTYGDYLPMDLAYDEMPSFLASTAQYDKEFFKKNTLFVVYVSANNSTHRYALKSIGYNENSFYVNIEEVTHVQAVDTAMAGWFVTVAVPDAWVRDCTDFSAMLNWE